MIRRAPKPPTKPRQSLQQRFAGKYTVLPDETERYPGIGGCHVWKASSDGRYGQIWVDGKWEKAHRVSWRLSGGRELAPKEVLLHACDNPPCVRFEHLSPGTELDNHADAVTKGRKIPFTPKERPQQMEQQPYQHLYDLMRKLTRFDEDPVARRHGSDAPKEAETAVGMARLRNLNSCIRSAVSDQVAGDIVETGVWRGGAMIFARAVLRAIEQERAGKMEGEPRRVWCFDSFEGLPAPDPTRFPADEGDPHHTLEYLRVDLETVQANFRRYGLLDARVKFVKGWFRDTLPGVAAVASAARKAREEGHEINRSFLTHIAVLRLDGDMYESTMLALDHLYPLVEPGGFVIVDDWSLTRARAAVNDYRRQHQISEALQSIDPYSIFWRRRAEA